MKQPVSARVSTHCPPPTVPHPRARGLRQPGGGHEDTTRSVRNTFRRYTVVRFRIHSGSASIRWYVQAGCGVSSRLQVSPRGAGGAGGGGSGSGAETPPAAGSRGWGGRAGARGARRFGQCRLAAGGRAGGGARGTLARAPPRGGGRGGRGGADGRGRLDGRGRQWCRGQQWRTPLPTQASHAGRRWSSHISRAGRRGTCPSSWWPRPQQSSAARRNRRQFRHTAAPWAPHRPGSRGGPGAGSGAGGGGGETGRLRGLAGRSS